MFKIGTKVFCLLIALSLTSIYFPQVLAQTQNTGAIQGRVFESGTLNPLPTVIVTVTHEEIGLERTTVSNDQGIYYVGILPAGNYPRASESVVEMVAIIERLVESGHAYEANGNVHFAVASFPE